MAASNAAFDLSASQGAAVLDLLERAEVPPLPAYYGLVYDYVSGVNGLAASRVGDILGDQAGSAGERLYTEFVAPYQNREPFERALAQMLARLTTLDRVIVETAQATRAHTASLEDASAKLSEDGIDASLIREWVVALDVANQRMRRANASLLREVATAQKQLDTTRAEIGRSKEGTRRDPLTGVANRGGLDDVLVRLIGEGAGPLSCAVIDIDHFKSLNDTYGHPVGDQVLLSVTQGLLASSRGADIVGRTGGDEFVVVFPDTIISVAHNVADGIRARIAATDLTQALGPDILGGITVSIGVAQFQRGETVAKFIDRADRCLYRAKQAGRNRVDSFGDVAV